MKTGFVQRYSGIWRFFQNYLKVTVRTLARNRTYSIINLAGLTVGIACCLLIFLIVSNEKSYDQYHERADDIYRLNVKWQSPEFEFENALTSAPFAPAFEDAFPAVEVITRITASSEKVLIRAGDNRIYTDDARFIYADPSVFDVFSFGFEGADQHNALSAPYTMVITRSMAQKLFNTDDALGKSVRVDDTFDYEITGVVNDVPANSHFHFDVLASMSSFNAGAGPTNGNWGNNPYFTYLRLPEQYDPVLLSDQFPAFLESNLSEDNRKWMSLVLQPVTAIHLHPKGNEIEAGGSGKYVTILWVIALAILVIACFNFVNLATARSMTRSQEVSMRKVAGAARSQLRVQFLTESVIITLTAGVLGYLLVLAALPTASAIVNAELGLINHPVGIVPIVLGLLLGTLVLGLIAGMYPAFIMSGMNTLRLLKGSGNSASGGSQKEASKRSRHISIRRIRRVNYRNVSGVQAN